MHSADYAVARCLSVRPSVRHTPVFCRNGYALTHILILFPPLGRHTILVFACQTVWQYSDKNPSNGDVECKGYAKIAIKYYGRRIGNRTQAFEWHQIQ